MKTIVKRLIRDEKGQVLIMALILLVVGGLIIAPLLAYMNTGLIAGGVYEKKTAELYAADAGVEDAIWKIQHQDEVEGPWPCNPGSPPFAYDITDVNGKSVHITIDYQDGGTYRITSIAITDDGGGTAAIVSGTKIKAYVTATYSDFSGLLDNVITSQNEIYYPPFPDISYPEGHGPVANYDGPWPTPADLEGFYGENVTDATHYYSDTEIDLEGNSCPPGPIYINDEAVNCPSGLGPLYIDGELEILNSIKTDPLPTLTLTGTIYITGDTLIGKNGKDFTLDLNGQTIFVASNSSDPQKALWIGGKCTIIGPGCIMAVGDVYFGPNIPVGMTDPIFILSVSGKTTLQPGGDFYGAVAGSVEVQLRPGTSLNYPEAGFGGYDLNFPGFTEAQPVHYSIASWEVSGLSPGA